MNAKITVTTRISPELHQRLKEIAERENRSISGQIVQFIEEGIIAHYKFSVAYWGEPMSQEEYLEYRKRTGEIDE